MKITTILHTHGVPEITMDTLDSVIHYMTDRVILLVDGVGWDVYEHLEVPAYKLKGFNHGWYKSPYRNIFLGMLAAATSWQDSDWICYLEYDCLVCSNGFKKDLEKVEKEGVWCIGNDFREKQTVDLRLLETIVGEKFKEVVYLLGACIFYHKDFIKIALEKEFFQRFLFYTNAFQRDFFPFYNAWDLTEHALPTIVKHYGGEVRQFARYNQKMGMWSGNYRKYPIRFRPDIEYDPDLFLQASILHPSKNFDDEVRLYHRSKRQNSRISAKSI